MFGVNHHRNQRGLRNTGFVLVDLPCNPACRKPLQGLETRLFSPAALFDGLRSCGRKNQEQDCAGQAIRQYHQHLCARSDPGAGTDQLR